MSSNSILNIKKDGEWVEIPCLKGEDGFSPTATVEKVGKVATITITDINGTTTATIADGTDSGGSGEENTIESISVNGTPISVDENKNVDITVPSIDGLTKDADLATVAKSGSYEDLSNKPTIPSLDGYAKTSEIPSKVSELTNDSNYQTAEQVSSTVTTEIAKVVADAPEDLNTLKEMSDWIAGHEDDASAMNSAISDNKTAITALQTGKADKSEIPTELPANGGNASTVNGHTVNSDVPENAKFTDTTYSDATQIEHGLMSVDDKKKLDGLKKYTPDGTTITADEDGTLHGVAEVTVDTALSDTSTNPVQNKVIKAYVDENVDFSTSTSKSLNDTVEAPLVLSNATRNLLNPTLQTTTQNGVTCTNNGDGTYTIDTGGSPSAAQTVFELTDITENVYENMKVLGCPSGGYHNTFNILITYYNESLSYINENYDIGSGAIIGSSRKISLGILIRSGQTINNLTFKPMVTTDLSATYDDFVPYSGYDIKTCGKNLMNLTKITTNNTGVTASLSNGIITLDGTVDTSGGWKDIYFGTPEQWVSLKRGVKYTISTKDKVQKVFLMLRKATGLKVLYTHDCYTNGTTFVASEDMVCQVTITFKESSTFNDTQIVPQIEVGENVTEYQHYQDGGTVHIDSTTEFPLLGLNSFDGITNIISPCNVEVTYAKSDSGAAILDTSENKLDKDNVVNNQTTTEAGFALDARQANPNIDGTLAKQISDLNGSLKSKILMELTVSEYGAVCLGLETDCIIDAVMLPVNNYIIIPFNVPPLWYGIICQNTPKYPIVTGVTIPEGTKVYYHSIN